VPLSDRKFVGQHYATSKITSFEDIDSVRSYGFRGEAIASLCVIGEVSVTTCVEGETTATTFRYDRTGSPALYAPRCELIKGKRLSLDKEGPLLL
jgi:DNA mismatch repair protein PMS2